MLTDHQQELAHLRSQVLQIRSALNDARLHYSWVYEARHRPPPPPKDTDAVFDRWLADIGEQIRIGEWLLAEASFRVEAKYEEVCGGVL